MTSALTFEDELISVLQGEPCLRRQNAVLRKLVARFLYCGFLPDPEPIGGWHEWAQKARSLGITYEEAEDDE